MLKNKDIIKRLEYYFSNIVLIWLAILFYRLNRYYSGFLRPETQTTLLWLAIAYSVIGLIVYVVLPVQHLKESKGAILLRSLGRLTRDGLAYLKDFTSDPKTPPPKIDPYERTVILFALVKIFFLPIMLNFLFENYNAMIGNFKLWQHDGFAVSIQSYNNIIYAFLFSVLLFIDTAFFSVGYSVEASWLKNKVRSVEPTLFGWVVALICYPPFNGVVGNYVTWYANDFVVFATPNITFVMRILAILLFVIYVWASVALGAKCSNLTNRGIVSSGPYAFVRHPAYISKNLAWWLTVIPVLNFANPMVCFSIILSTILWTIIYFLRAITEERHLINDPDYVEYCKKVKYRFVPYIY